MSYHPVSNRSTDNPYTSTTFTNKIENLTTLISKLEREIRKVCLETLNIPKKVLVVELKDNVKDLSFADNYIEESNLDDNAKQLAKNQLSKFQKKLTAIEEDQDISINEIKKIKISY